MKGTLYVVATPLGNLEDITERALRILREVDLIAAEDTRHSRNLLRHFGIDKPLTSYYDEIEANKAPRLIEQMREGKSIALICDAGTPGIADPGYRLVRGAVEAGIDAIPIPGPSAIAAALSVCGLPTDRFAFEGFLPPKSGRRRKRLEELKADPRTLVLYEAPHRIAEVLADLAELFGARPAVVIREATKLHETVVRGTLAELRDGAAQLARGEITLVVAGADESETVVEIDEAELDREIAVLRAEGKHTREIAAALGLRYGLSHREMYRKVLEATESRTGSRESEDG